MCPKIRCDGYCLKFFEIKQGLSQVGVYGTVLKNHKRRYRRGEMLTSKLVGDAATERYNDSCNSVGACHLRDGRGWQEVAYLVGAP